MQFIPQPWETNNPRFKIQTPKNPIPQPNRTIQQLKEEDSATGKHG